MNTSPPASTQTLALGAPLPRWLWATGLAALALRLWISVALPISGDEAFFYWWGVYPAWGYSDHPPMVGWLIAAMRWLLGDTTWAIRLPVVLLPTLMGGMLWWALAPVNRVRAAWAVLLFWLAPINWLSALITTDTPLIFWSMASACCLLVADRRSALDARAWGLYALSGLFLGAAFLSKYFAVVLGLAYLVHFALWRRDRLVAFALMLLCALPGPLINIAWNMDHCWSNIMFNLINRNSGEKLSFAKPATFVGMMVYLISPVAVWLSWKHRSALGESLRSHRLLACLALVPLLFFALLSPLKTIGLHWVLSFYPFGFALLAFGLPAHRLKLCALGLAVLTGLHVLAVGAIALTPLSRWEGTKYYEGIVRGVRTAEMLKQVDAPGVVLMANAFTPASTYGYALRRYVPVFGVGRHHSRQDDQLIDFSVYQGQTIRIIHTAKFDLESYRPYFDSIELLTFQQDALTFYAVEGKGFRYDAFRDGVLAEINRRFYRIPSWLPMTRCRFCERLCGQMRCAATAPTAPEPATRESDD